MPVTQVYRQKYDAYAINNISYELQPFEYDVILPLSEATKLVRKYIEAMAFEDAALEPFAGGNFFSEYSDHIKGVIRDDYFTFAPDAQIMVKFISLKSLHVKIDRLQEEIDTLYGQVTQLESLRKRYDLSLVE